MSERATISVFGAACAALGRAPAGSRTHAALRDGERVAGPELAVLAGELAALAPASLADAERASLVRWALAWAAAVASGSTRIPVAPSAERDTLFAATGADAGAIAVMDRHMAAWREERGHPVRVVLGEPGERKPLLVTGESLTSERAHRAEATLAAHVATRLGRALLVDDASLGAALAEVASGGPLAPTPEQRAALATACARAFTAVTGGPGTGKTTVVVALVRALARLGVPPASIALAAPTGRAASRLDAAVRRGLAAVGAPSADDVALAATLPGASTLHRLLGGVPGRARFLHHAGNPLDARVVVVDEASMVDLDLMTRLVGAMPDDARLVLLGDEDQLASVGAGAVFRDVVRAGGDAVARLSTNLRTTDDDAGRRVLAAARAINAGEGDALARDLPLRARAADVTFRGVERLARLDDALVERLAREHAVGEEARRRVFSLVDGAPMAGDVPALRAALVQAERRKILCVARDTAAWVDRRMHARVGAGDGLSPGEPVMVTRNDHARGLFNGDAGVVVRAAAPGGRDTVVAVFARGDGVVVAPVDDRALGLVRAFAVTVHKAQGSEHDAVVLVLPAEPGPLLGRELVYTAVTRARSGALIVGDLAVLQGAVARPTPRWSGVAEALDARASARQDVGP